MSKLFEFNRTYSFFEPTFTYNVWSYGKNIGAVARNDNNPRKWYASNKNLEGGGDLVNTFSTRYEAANALWNLSTGNASVSTYGGYKS